MKIVETSSDSPDRETRKRGRPRKNGSQGANLFARIFFGLHYYHEARLEGMKYESALREAARRLNCSVTEIKRIRAKWQPRGAKIGFVTGDRRPLFEVEMRRGVALGLPGVWLKTAAVLPVSIGPIPVYPRHNGRSSGNNATLTR